MNSVQTMDFNATDSGMVPILSRPPENQERPSLSPPTDARDTDYNSHQNNVEKNIHKEQEMNIDSTPISDLMSAPEVMDQSQGVPMPPPSQTQVPQNTMPVATPQMVEESKKAESKNPMNLTDEQYNALVVGVVCVIAFSDPVQNKLANFIPQFVKDDGTRSTTGIAVTGIAAAIIYYFGNRMLKR